MEVVLRGSEGADVVCLRPLLALAEFEGHSLVRRLGRVHVEPPGGRSATGADVAASNLDDLAAGSPRTERTGARVGKASTSRACTWSWEGRRAGSLSRSSASSGWRRPARRAGS